MHSSGDDFSFGWFFIYTRLLEVSSAGFRCVNAFCWQTVTRRWNLLASELSRWRLIKGVKMERLPACLPCLATLICQCQPLIWVPGWENLCCTQWCKCLMGSPEQPLTFGTFLHFTYQKLFFFSFSLPSPRGLCVEAAATSFCWVSFNWCGKTLWASIVCVWCRLLLLGGKQKGWAGKKKVCPDVH